MSEKMRVHILAKELNVSSKAIIDKCKAEGIDAVKNHMSTLSAGLHATIIEWFSEGRHETALETSDRIDLEKVRIPRRARQTAGGDDTTLVEDDESTFVEDGEEVEELPADVEAEVEPTGPATITAPVSAPVEVTAPVVGEETTTRLRMPARVEAAPAQAPAVAASVETAVAAVGAAPSARAVGVAPAGPQNVPTPAKLQGPRVVRYEAPEQDLRPIRRPAPGTGAPPRRPGEVLVPPAPGTLSEAARAAEREATRRARLNSRRAVGRMVEAGERLAEWRDRDLAERRERLAGVTGRRAQSRRRAAPTSSPSPQPQQPAGPKTSATVHEPVRLKDFCAATGLNFIQLFKVLKDDFGQLVNINTVLSPDTAQLLALQFGIELTVVPAKTRLDELEDEYNARGRDNLTPRSPVVTMLGHVDHGKTSLLDAIRKARVASTEDGGITQHIGSYHIQTARGAVTFLDTPGHQAFTAMRARGAQLTDVVVLVVAADDGLMPQTIEAINHAKAASVPIVVALNKIDLGDQNKLKIYGQLSEHGLAPSEWGGEVDVVATSATTGVGVKELVEHLADLSSVLDLKSDATLPAVGTVIEAETKPGAGAVARVLIQEGTLRVGDVVVVGNAAGKVRALLSDTVHKVESAGPGIPVEVWGLDDVPAAGDRLYQVDTLPRAKEIAAEVRQTRVDASRIQIRKAKTLEEMLRRRESEDVPELSVVIRADVDGSVVALKQSLSEIPSDKVKLNVRHSGVGAVTDSDVLLAATISGIVIAFRVEPSPGAKKLADQHGVEIRSYRVIYDVVDDVKLALEGLLAPEEKIESRATIEVRQIFHIGKLGVVAGSMVTSGTVERNQVAKVVRDGVVVRDGCRFASLRRFKDDVKEVRNGLECGVRLEGFDDLHAGDIIQTYEVIKVARKL